MHDLRLGTVMERTHKNGFALWTFPNLFLIFNLHPVPAVALVFCSLILFASVPKFRVVLQQSQPPRNIDVVHSYLSRLITRCYLNQTAHSFRLISLTDFSCIYASGLWAYSFLLYFEDKNLQMKDIKNLPTRPFSKTFLFQWPSRCLIISETSSCFADVT